MANLNSFSEKSGEEPTQPPVLTQPLSSEKFGQFLVIVCFSISRYPLTQNKRKEKWRKKHTRKGMHLFSGRSCKREGMDMSCRISWEKVGLKVGVTLSVYIIWV